MNRWWEDEAAPWRATLASLLFPGIDAPGHPDEPPLRAIVEDHRLGPWLHARHAGDVPDWAADARHAMAMALLQQQVLGDLLDRLASAGITPILLKGTPLSLFAYAQPWHRPMRDLDLLVGSDTQALAAQELLLGAGYALLPGHEGDAAALPGERHQLPLLVAPDGTTYVELHGRLFHGQASEDHLRETVERPALGRTVRMLTSEAQVLHLVGHAARDHRFDNGPQVLVDLAMLWTSQRVDAARLATLAAQSGLERHCALLATMATDAFPEAGIVWPHAPDSGLEDAAVSAWRMMTSPTELVAPARDRLSTRASSVRRIASRLFPSPARLASAQGRASGPLALLVQYGAHYRRLATERAPRMLATSTLDKELAALVDWLEA